MPENQTLRRLTEQEVSNIFVDPHSEAARRWVQYWSSTESRNRVLLTQFREVVSLGFEGKTVLDVGCGSAGLAASIISEGGHYAGLDYSPYVLQMGHLWLRRNGINPLLVRGSGSELPLRDHAFDYIFAFDVIEHLEGGLPQQLQFLQELRRVIRPSGMIFLTTPNKWYPFEGHTFLYFPQFLPISLADAYIRRKNPGFLQEHASFRAIKLLTPGDLKQLLDQSGLSLLHQLPCALDLRDLPEPRRSAFRCLSLFGLAWHPLQEFWGCLVRSENRQALRVKCRKHHQIALHESQVATREFGNEVDFDRSPSAHQLKRGWFPHERNETGFRWTARDAELWLQASGGEDFLSLSGYCNGSERPGPVVMDVYCDGQWIGRHVMTENETIDARFLLPRKVERLQICTVRIEVHPTHTPGGADERKLGVILAKIGLVKTADL
ncbi:MAG TPA: class I SAM-dependent methyltransferase [Acidobacteriota bacterium]|jgi:SAM-dependent methyltransferase